MMMMTLFLLLMIDDGNDVVLMILFHHYHYSHLEPKRDGIDWYSIRDDVDGIWYYSLMMMDSILGDLMSWHFGKLTG